MRKVICFIFTASFLSVTLGQSKQDSTLFLSKLYGISHIVMNDPAIDTMILNCFQLVLDNKNPSFNLIVEEIKKKLPPKRKCKEQSKNDLTIYNLDWIDSSQFLSQELKEKIKNEVSCLKSTKNTTQEFNVFKYERHSKNIKDLNSQDRLECILIIYNYAQFYYPYIIQLRPQLETAFVAVIDEFQKGSLLDDKRYVEELRKFIHSFYDSHVSLSKSISNNELRKHIKEDKREDSNTKDLIQRKLFPIEVREVGSQLIITNVNKDWSQENVFVGQSVDSINFKAVEEIKGDLSSTKCFSNKSSLEYDLFNRQSYLYSFNLDTLTLHIEHRKVVLPKIEMKYEKYLSLRTWNSSKEDLVQESNFNYINLANVSSSKIKLAYRDARKKDKAIILDLREYPNNFNATILPTFYSNKPKKVATFYTPYKKNPGIYTSRGNDQTYYYSNRVDFFLKALNILPNHWNIFYSFRKKFKGKTVVLINERTISWGETLALILQTYCPDISIVGRNSRGANGNICAVELPGRIELTFTHYLLVDNGNKIFPKKGIKPDVFVPVTFCSNNCGEYDPILLKGIEVLRD